MALVLGDEEVDGGLRLTSSGADPRPGGSHHAPAVAAVAHRGVARAVGRCIGPGRVRAGRRPDGRRRRRRQRRPARPRNPVAATVTSAADPFGRRVLSGRAASFAPAPPEPPSGVMAPDVPPPDPPQPTARHSPARATHSSRHSKPSDDAAPATTSPGHLALFSLPAVAPVYGLSAFRLDDAACHRSHRLSASKGDCFRFVGLGDHEMLSADASEAPSVLLIRPLPRDAGLLLIELAPLFQPARTAAGWEAALSTTESRRARQERSAAAGGCCEISTQERRRAQRGGRSGTCIHRTWTPSAAEMPVHGGHEHPERFDDDRKQPADHNRKQQRALGALHPAVAPNDENIAAPMAAATIITAHPPSRAGTGSRPVPPLPDGHQADQ